MKQLLKSVLALALMFALPPPGRPAARASGALESPSVHLAEGLGIDGVAVGYSDMSSVVARYGEDFSLIEHRKYSYEIKYLETGLSFWYRYDDPQKRIFCVSVRPPCRCFTGRGIVLGVSTLQDVFDAYGPSEFHTSTAEETWFAEYPGIEFHVEFDPKEKSSWKPKDLLRKKVVEIDILAVEPEVSVEPDAAGGS